MEDLGLGPGPDTEEALGTRPLTVWLTGGLQVVTRSDFFFFPYFSILKNNAQPSFFRMKSKNFP